MLNAGHPLRDGRYRITRVLGEGSQGTTFEAVDAKLGRLVAIKRFQVRGAASWKDVELAEREAVVLGALKHPLIPAYVEHFEEEAALYLVTELVAGQNLRQRAAGGTMSLDEVLRLLSDLSQVIEYLHGLHPPVIHRDIKPGNIIRREDGRFMLVDFGSVRAKLELSQGSTVVGTFGFMAPEQFQGRALPQSDVYSLGATVLSLMTGLEPEKLPHRGLAIDVRASLGPNVDRRIVELLERMLNPDPDQRLPRVSSALQVFRRLRAGAANRPAAPASQPPPPSRRARRGNARPPFDVVPPWSKRYQARPLGRSAELAPPREIALPLLSVARAAVYFGAVFFAPLVLSLLSIIFGKPLRRAAYQTREAGERALRAMDLKAQSFLTQPIHEPVAEPVPVPPAAAPSPVANAQRRVEANAAAPQEDLIEEPEQTAEQRSATRL